MKSGAPTYLDANEANPELDSTEQSDHAKPENPSRNKVLHAIEEQILRGDFDAASNITKNNNDRIMPGLRDQLLLIEARKNPIQVVYERAAHWGENWAEHELLVLEGLRQECLGNFDRAIDCYRSVLAERNSLLLAHRLAHALHRAFRNDELPSLYEEFIYPKLPLPRWVPSAPLDRVQVQNAIVVFYFGRSGANFLCSLLDSHPEVIGPPAGYENCGYIYKNGGFASSKTAVAMIAFPFRSDANLDRVLNNTQAWNFQLNEETPESLRVDRWAFLSALEHIFEQRQWGIQQKLEGDQYLTALCLAYALARGIPFQNGPVSVLFHAHHRLPSRERFIRDSFRELRVLFSIRSPFAALASHCLSDSRLELFANCPEKLASTECFGKNQGCEFLDHELWKSSFGVRLDDLKTRPHATLLALCGFLGISWNKSLLESTFGGEALYQTTCDGQTITGFDRKSLNRDYSHIFSTWDQLRIKLMTANTSREWGYFDPPWHVSFRGKALFALGIWWPFRFEIDQVKRALKLNRRLSRVLLDAVIEYRSLRKLFVRNFFMQLSNQKKIVRRLRPLEEGTKEVES